MILKKNVETGSGGKPFNLSHVNNEEVNKVLLGNNALFSQKKKLNQN